MFFTLIEEAKVIFDARDNNLKREADGFNGFFSQGAGWMYDALKVIRSTDFPMPLKLYNFHGALKYMLSLAATLIPITLAIKFNAIWVLLLVPFFFYWVEAQFVFLFPLLIDNCASPYLKSFELTRRCGGASVVMFKVMPIAAVMLVGGFFGMGFRRSWCLGCLSILLWYEKIKNGI
jgi:hypothetical protein